ncbi:unnamed protein product [Paramecium sonneborni]|uniref:Uncharacterized protein n=1 Tax=Paramecium sonneborni TaxID=65129 RepID=A0A8S1RNK8_9CILI|nr:unnamed protein product [Paramecium sonneborni]
MISEIMHNFFYLSSGGKTDCYGQKNGWWVELNDKLAQCHDQVSHYCDEYKEGKKIGRWDTKIKVIFNGGGEYDLNETKIGQWVELITNFSKKNEVKISGFYKKGLKNDQWNTLLREENDEEIIRSESWKMDGIEFKQLLQIYSHWKIQQRFKDKQMNIIFKKYDTDDYKIIGGGLYNQEGIKHGKWIEIQNKQEDFDIIAYIGEYKNGKKNGLWDIIQGSTEMNEYYMIGGGCYDENGLEKGLWTNIEQFSFKFSVISIGKYSNGKKIKKWETKYQQSKQDEFGEWMVQ